MKQATALSVLLLMAVAPAAQTSSPLLLVLNKNDATLSFIDPVSGNTVGTVRTGPDPHEVTTTGDGRLAIATNYGGNSLSVIDIAARKELQRLAFPDLQRPHGIETVGGLVVFTAEANQAVAAYDPVTNRIAWRASTRQNVTHMVIASRDGQTLFTSNIGSNSITILERAGSEWRPTHVSVGAGPEGLDLSPDGRELWTAHSEDGRVSIIDVASKKVTQTFDAGTRRANRLKFTRDGRYALISDIDAGAVVVVDAKARTVARRVQVGTSPEGILVPPQSTRAYIAVTGDNRVVALDLTTFAIVQTITTGRGPDGMAWVR